MTDSDVVVKPEERTKFEVLPERQAKISSMLNPTLDWDMHTYCKPTPSTENDLYCVCRSSDTSTFMICCDQCNEWYHGDCIGVTEKLSKTILQYFCHNCKDIDPALETQYKKKKIKDDPDYDKGVQNSQFGRAFGKDSKSKGRKARRCGECIACYRTEDCRRCDFCKDMTKFGGPNKIRQKCRQRQCLNFGLVLGRNNVPTSKYRDDSPGEADDTSDTEHRSRVLKDINRHKNLAEGFVNDGAPVKKKDLKKKAANKVRDGRKGKKDRKKLHSERHRKKKHRRHRHRRHRDGEHDRRRHRRRDSKQEDDDNLRQCYGPECTQSARPGSKYCGDQCGINLAMNRIYRILPQRIQYWNSSQCAAEESSKRQLEVIRNQQAKARKLLEQLDVKHQRLISVLAKAKQAPIAPEQENNDNEEDGEISYYCVTCGLETGAKPALRHMEKCFNKYESQTSYGSVFKTRIEGSYNMFCDAFNALQGTYCKRLRVLCPEHCKDPKIPDDEVCGCPLVADVFQETGEFCRSSRKKCNKHYCWEKLRMAEIDMDRVRHWLTLDDLFEQERTIRLAMADRAGVLGLMLHNTVAHEETLPLGMPPPAAADGTGMVMG